jgi:hypothetical protein
MTPADVSRIGATIVRLLAANPAWSRASVRWGDPVTRELSDVLSDALGWPRHDHIAVSATPNQNGSIRIEHVAMSLLEEAQQSTAEQSVRRLMGFLAENTVGQLEVVALWGFEPTSVVPLLPDISLMPFSSLPSSGGKERLSQSPSANPYALTPRPQAALVRKFTYGPIVDPHLVPLVSSGSQRIDRTSQVPMLLEVVRVMTLLVDGPVAAIAYWPQAAAPLPWINVDGGGGFEILRQFSFAGEQATITDDQVELVRQYMALGNGEKAGLRIPLERLNSAKLHLHSAHVADSVLDLGIALEALLCSDDEPLELSYRFRVRGALLRGGDYALRKDTYEVLKELYLLRSKVAHGKEVKEVRVKGRPSTTGRGKEGLRAFLQEAIALALELMQTVVRRGSLPDWERLALNGNGGEQLEEGLAN